MLRYCHGPEHVGVSVRALRVAFFIIATVACGEEALLEQGTAVAIDSAGVQIVTSERLGTNARCVLGDAPILSIGAVEGDEPHLFYQIRHAARLSDGSIAVVDGSSREVRIFSATGEHLRSMGGAGDGPGEFRGPWLLWVLPGDTLWVGDYIPWRFNVFSPAGEFSRAVQPDPYQLHAFIRGGVLANGTSVNVTQAMTPPGGNSAAPVTFLVEVHGPDGALIDTIAALPGRRFEPVSDYPGFFLPTLFGASPLVAARGTNIAMTTARDPEVRILDEVFRLRRIVRWAEPAREVTAGHLRAFRDDYVAERGGRASPGWSNVDEAAINDARTVADLFPTAADLMIGRDGRLWLKRFARPREESAWMAFNPDGTFSCHFAPGLDLTPYEFGADYVLALDVDDLGTERVVMHRLDSPGGGPGE